MGTERGILLFDQGRYEEAKTKFDKAGGTTSSGAATMARRSGPSASIPEDTSASSIRRLDNTRPSQEKATKKPKSESR